MDSESTEDYGRQGERLTVGLAYVGLNGDFFDSRLTPLAGAFS
jgi:hypothetical protein